MRSEGRIFQRGAVFWIAYYVRGKEFREPGGKTEKEAAKRLKVRRAEKHGGRFIGPEQERVTVGTLLDSYLANLERKKAKGIGPARSVVSKVRAIFGDTLAVEVSVKRLERFVESELVQGKAPATVNRALGSLRNAFNLAQKQGCLSRVPYFPMLREDNARQVAWSVAWSIEARQHDSSPQHHPRRPRGKPNPRLASHGAATQRYRCEDVLRLSLWRKTQGLEGRRGISR